MKFRVVRTNQYNQDLGLIHSTNGNHLECPNEGSSIDHQVSTRSLGSLVVVIVLRIKDAVVALFVTRMRGERLFRTLISCWDFVAPMRRVVLLAEPLGSLAFKMVQVRQLMEEQQVKLETSSWVRQLMEEQQVKLETSSWVALCLSKAYVFRVSAVSF
ncbi:hypothetical protein F511_05873 [Dorcoceras hygrometricum]|uniref:Uncharacterized protein n=1 Tax=Dorcoceras hygrometricum TaxID=472368 RepID=A0A2Z7B5F5_9LAMI|nr:hypothetical protein F511_05873 [Dorcoceras hygrometricum]